MIIRPHFITSNYRINDILQMKKPHPSGTNPFNIITIPPHIPIKSQHSQPTLMIPPQLFNNKIKKLLQSHQHKQTYQ
ncbi:DUF951 family protein, partial [Staphylococcus epidermidis]|uniref:DUF951 family protein n=1 Tax=Staphylococcus epidermidis TaxID=1282 RepID=UPI003F689A84